MMKQMYRLMGKRRKNRGAMWVSLFSVGIGAAILGMLTGKRKDSSMPMNNIMKNFTPRNLTPKTNINMMDNAALTEFSEEILSNALNTRNNRSNTNNTNANPNFANNHDTPNNNQY